MKFNYVILITCQFNCQGDTPLFVTQLAYSCQNIDNQLYISCEIDNRSGYQQEVQVCGNVSVNNIYAAGMQRERVHAYE